MSVEPTTQDIRNAIGQIGIKQPAPYAEPDADTLAQAALVLALSSIARHLDRIYERLAHIEHHLEDR